MGKKGERKIHPSHRPVDRVNSRREEDSELPPKLIRILTIVARRRRRGRGLGLIAAADLEDDLHVVAGAPSADAPVEVILGRGADEVVIVAREELETPGLRRERPEGDGEVHRFARLVAHRYHPWTRVRYPTCLILLLRHLHETPEKFYGRSARIYVIDRRH